MAMPKRIKEKERKTENNGLYIDVIIYSLGGYRDLSSLFIFIFFFSTEPHSLILKFKMFIGYKFCLDPAFQEHSTRIFSDNVGK